MRRQQLYLVHNIGRVAEVEPNFFKIDVVSFEKLLRCFSSDKDSHWYVITPLQYLDTFCKLLANFHG